MKKLTFHLLFLILISLIFTQCADEKYPGFKKSSDGVYYKVHYTENKTAITHDSDWFEIRLDYRLEDTVLYRSSDSDEDMIIPNLPAIFKGDLYDGLKLMGDGDSMSFAVVADSFFLNADNIKKLPPFVESGSPMYFDVKLLKRYTNQEYLNMLESREEDAVNLEKDKLQKYLKSNNIDVEPQQSGLYFMSLKEGSGKRPDTGEMCQVYMSVKVLDGNFLFSNFGKDLIDIEYGKGFDTEGLRLGLGMLRVGGKADLIVPSTIGVGSNGMATVEGYTTLLYTLELVNITSVEQVKKERAERKKIREAEAERFKDTETQRIQEYVTVNNISEKPRASGLYLIYKKRGSGDSPKIGDKVKTHYTLYNIEGDKIQSSKDNGEPFEFVVGRGQVIRGWEEAIMLMKPGGSAKLIVPSKMAYGKRGKGSSIPPYSPLLFDIELIEIEN